MINVYSSHCEIDLGALSLNRGTKVLNILIFSKFETLSWVLITTYEYLWVLIPNKLPKIWWFRLFFVTLQRFLNLCECICESINNFQFSIFNFQLNKHVTNTTTSISYGTHGAGTALFPLYSSTFCLAEVQGSACWFSSFRASYQTET